MAVGDKNEENVELDDDTLVEVELDPILAARAAEEEEEEEADAAGKKPGERQREERRSALPSEEEIEKQEKDNRQQQDKPEDQQAVALKEALERSEAGRRAATTQAEAERLRAEEATRLAQAHQQEAEAAQQQVADQELLLVEQGLEAANGELDAAKKAIKAANEAGDFDAAADAQAKLALAAAKVDRLSSTKQQLEARPKEKPAATEGRVELKPQVSPERQTQLDRYYASMDPTSAAWVRAHPECLPAGLGGDPKKNARMMAGHYAAIEKGLPGASDEYFAFLEEHLGYRQPTSKAADTRKAGEEQEPEPAERQQQQQRKPAQARPSAPVTRDPPNNSQRPGQRQSIRLTKDQVDAALLSFPHLPREKALQQYAQNYAALEAEGKIGRTTH